MALIKCSECGGQISDTAVACIHCGAPISKAGLPTSATASVAPKKGSALGGIFRFLIAIVIVVFAVSYFADDSADHTSQINSATSPKDVIPNTQKPVVDVPPQLPGDELAFINAVAVAQRNSRDAANDMQRGGHKATRDRQICSTLQALQVHDWVGTVDEVNANSDGRGVLGLVIAPDIRIGTWNNDLSDFRYHTLIEPESPLFGPASNLNVGQPVRFSGSFFRGSGGDCVAEMSLTLKGKLSSPEFVFKFLSVSTDLSASSRPTPMASVPPASTPSNSIQRGTVSNATVTSSLDRVNPSFDCAKAHFLDEQTICRNSELAFLDRQMASYYVDASKVRGDSPKFRQDGYQWLEKRRSCQDNIVCMKRLYADRIDELSRIAEK